MNWIASATFAAIAAALSSPALACEQWDLTGSNEIEQANSLTVLTDFRQSGAALEGSAKYVTKTLMPGVALTVDGTVNGTVEGVIVRFRVAWTTVQWSSTGVYEGAIAADGRVEGINFDIKDAANKVAWYMRAPAKCSAKPASAPVEGPAGAPINPNSAQQDTGGIAGPRTPNASSSVLEDKGGAAGGQPDALMPYGSIGEKYAKLGGTKGALGPPVDTEKEARHGGRCHAFRHGTMCWHPQIGEAFATWGLIHDKWLQLNRVDYGYPITDERTTSDGRGRFNHFRAMQYPERPEGSIFWSPQTGAHAIYGLIRDAWAKQGWERGPLGYPTSEEHQEGKFRRMNFERGHILWAPDTGIQIKQ